jgi:hypothetical protein
VDEKRCRLAFVGAIQWFPNVWYLGSHFQKSRCVALKWGQSAEEESYLGFGKPLWSFINEIISCFSKFHLNIISTFWSFFTWVWILDTMMKGWAMKRHFYLFIYGYNKVMVFVWIFCLIIVVLFLIWDLVLGIWIWETTQHKCINEIICCFSNFH